jgi:Fe-S cluster assembly protein SufD
MTAAPFASALQQLRQPAWLYETRREALAGFLHTGLPQRGVEDWRYTSLAHLDRLGLHLPTPSPDAVVAIDDYPGVLRASHDDVLVWQDTRLPRSQFGSLYQALRRASLRERFGSLAGPTALAQLNSALWRDGACLAVPANERLRLPVCLRQVAAEREGMLHPRLLVVMETRADAVLVEHFSAETDAPYWRNPVSEIHLAAGARLTHIRLIEEGAEATHTALTVVRLSAGSTYRALDLSLSGRLLRHDLKVELAGEGAAAHLDGLFLVNGRAHADHHLQVSHTAARTTSRMTWRGMAGGRGRGVFDGLVRVAAGALQADAWQSSRNLLLSPQAEIDARPQLEIRTDDVRCAHGATVGQLDADALFYLQSRGIDAASARSLLLNGFANEALALLDDAGLGEWLRPRIEASLRRMTESP